MTFGVLLWPLTKKQNFSGTSATSVTSCRHPEGRANSWIRWRRWVMFLLYVLHIVETNTVFWVLIHTIRLIMYKNSIILYSFFTHGGFPLIAAPFPPWLPHPCYTLVRPAEIMFRINNNNNNLFIMNSYCTIALVNCNELVNKIINQQLEKDLFIK